MSHELHDQAFGRSWQPASPKAQDEKNSHERTATTSTAPKHEHDISGATTPESSSESSSTESATSESEDEPSQLSISPPESVDPDSDAPEQEHGIPVAVTLETEPKSSTPDTAESNMVDEHIASYLLSPGSESSASSQPSLEHEQSISSQSSSDNDQGVSSQPSLDRSAYPPLLDRTIHLRLKMTGSRRMTVISRIDPKYADILPDILRYGIRANIQPVRNCPENLQVIGDYMEHIKFVLIRHGVPDYQIRSRCDGDLVPRPKSGGFDPLSGLPVRKPEFAGRNGRNRRHGSSLGVFTVHTGARN